jgi:hypothetical protein
LWGYLKNSTKISSNNSKKMSSKPKFRWNQCQRCENGLNIFKFTKDIVIVKRPWKRKWFFWLVSYNDWLIIDCYNWLVVVIGPCVTFAHTFNIYYPIFIVYWLGKSKHLTLNLNEIINGIAQIQCILGAPPRKKTWMDMWTF